MASSLEGPLSALDKAARGGPLDQTTASFLQSLDRLSYPKAFQCQPRKEGLKRTCLFLRETAGEEPMVQRAVWATPEEMEPDFVEPDSSVLRRGLSLLRSLCAVETGDRFLLVSHPKLVERLTTHPIDNGELFTVSLDCALRRLLQEWLLQEWLLHSGSTAAVQQQQEGQQEGQRQQRQQQLLSPLKQRGLLLQQGGTLLQQQQVQQQQRPKHQQQMQQQQRPKQQQQVQQQQQQMQQQQTPTQQQQQMQQQQRPKQQQYKHTC
ncbi:hypothetical protein, conserved [Eimeria brunetti]|uniref:Uncharacterized protein n=1 Tax=Eimeria brunetti TaxID=51314 RepID=U6LHV9_9EIME|nr:hypothetical protein, conserved [Eimeria brunetti]